MNVYGSLFMNLLKKLCCILICTLLVAILNQCRKGAAEFTLKGNISDQTLNTGLIGATIQLYKVPAGSTEKILVESKVIPDDGSYSFTFQREAIEKYVLLIEKENYFPIEENIFFASLTTTEDNIRNYNTTAKSWVKIRLKNENAQASDHLRYIKQDGKVNCLECCPSTEQNYYGNLDTSIYCVNDANTNYSIYYWIIGTSQQNLLSANTSIFDTTEISLIY